MSLEIGALGVELRIHQAPGLSVSALPFMFSIPFAAAFSSRLSHKYTGRCWMCVHACLYQTALSSVLWALTYQPRTVRKPLDARSVPASLIESWKPSFGLGWMCYLHLPVISHLHVIKQRHYEWFPFQNILRCSLNSHLRKPDVSAQSLTNIYVSDNLQNHRFQIKNKFSQIMCSWLNLFLFFV